MRPRKEINIRIGSNIQRTRERFKYTQEELSELIGITPNHLSAIERGVSGASLETIENLCLLLGISADFLLFGENKSDASSNELFQQLSRVKPQYRPQIQKIVLALLEMCTLQEKSFCEK